MNYFNLLLLCVLAFRHVFMFCLQEFLTYMILMTVHKILRGDSDDSVEDSDDCVVSRRYLEY